MPQFTFRPGRGVAGYLTQPFVAIDFETADQGRDSACAVALVRVEQGAIVRREVRLIRPPRRNFLFTWVHGITWDAVANAPTFAEVWAELSQLLNGATLLAAHNSAFDRGVLKACCEQGGLTPPALPFHCSMQLARKHWNVRPTKLPDVCRFLGLPLQHHDAGSDAEACARILLEVARRAAAISSPLAPASGVRG
jgi:DNA polymerase-3 subunit epsilon